MTPLELLLFAIAGITLLELAAFAVIALAGLSGVTVGGLLGLYALAGSTIVAGLIAVVDGLAHLIRPVFSGSRASTMRRSEVPLHG